jgi:fucose permease
MSTFARDRYTWATYGVFALLGFAQSSLGPILPTLREELDFSYALGGVHLSTFALGALLASVAAPRAVGALDLRRVLWLSVCGMAGGCLLLAVARSATVTLLATGVIGVFTAWIVAAVQALLSAHHGANRTVALVEVDVAASLGAFVAPLAVAAAQSVGAGWRAVLVSAAAAGVLLTASRGRMPFPRRGSFSPEEPPTGPLRLGYALVLIFSVVAVEWSVGFWAATVLHDRAEAGMATAAAGAGAFFGAMLAGRVLASALVRRATARAIMTAALSLALAGYPFFWFARTPELAVFGLLVVGLAIAPMFPLAISLGLRHSPDHPVPVVARMGVVGSFAILAAPYSLGELADRLSLFAALGAVPVLLVLAAVALHLDHRRARLGEALAPSAAKRASRVPAYETGG